MIQDIEPKHLYNEYIHCQPKKEDTVLYFHKNTVLARMEENQIVFPECQDFSKDSFLFYYLFSVDQKQYFLALEKELSLKAEGHDHVLKELLQMYEFIPVNAFRTARPQETAFAMITAFHLNCWYRDNRICGRCGKPLVHDTKERMMKCDCCHNMIYPKICPAVIVAVTDQDKLLLTKYAGRSYTNYALIAGFAEIGETIEQTVQREVMEEVGLKVKNIRYYKSQPWAMSGSLLMGFFCELDGDNKIVLQEDELALGEWVKASDMDIKEDHVSLTNEMMMKFQRDTLNQY